MKILILTQAVDSEARIDIKDVNDEAGFVSEILKGLGHDVTIRNVVELDLEWGIESIKSYSPDIVFNLVEDIDGHNRLNPIGAMIMEHLSIPFTGSPSSALSMTTDKLVAKRIMSLAGIDTPNWLTSKQILTDWPTGFRPSDKFIIKPVCEDASVGIGYGSVCTSAELKQKFIGLGPKANEYFAELYIDGQEIFVSLLYDPAKLKMLALKPTEIIYLDHPPEIPEIMAYESKWESGTCKYQHDSRCLRDEVTIFEASRTARMCAKAFGLRGYARVDIRMKDGIPMVIDINANPHLGKDSYFIDSAGVSGKSSEDVLSSILEDSNGR